MMSGKDKYKCIGILTAANRIQDTLKEQQFGDEIHEAGAQQAEYTS